MLQCIYTYVLQGLANPRQKTLGGKKMFKKLTTVTLSAAMMFSVATPSLIGAGVQEEIALEDVCVRLAITLTEEEVEADVLRQIAEMEEMWMTELLDSSITPFGYVDPTPFDWGSGSQTRVVRGDPIVRNTVTRVSGQRASGYWNHSSRLNSTTAWQVTARTGPSVSVGMGISFPPPFNFINASVSIQSGNAGGIGGFIYNVPTTGNTYHLYETNRVSITPVRNYIYQGGGSWMLLSSGTTSTVVSGPYFGPRLTGLRP